jgi:hypothetical protein
MLSRKAAEGAQEHVFNGMRVELKGGIDGTTQVRRRW